MACGNLVFCGAGGGEGIINGTESLVLGTSGRLQTQRGRRHNGKAVTVYLGGFYSILRSHKLKWAGKGK